MTLSGYTVPNFHGCIFIFDRLRACFLGKFFFVHTWYNRPFCVRLFKERWLCIKPELDSFCWKKLYIFFISRSVKILKSKLGNTSKEFAIFSSIVRCRQSVELRHTVTWNKVTSPVYSYPLYDITFHFVNNVQMSWKL